MEHIRPPIHFIKAGGDFHSLNPPEAETFEELRARSEAFYDISLRISWARDITCGIMERFFSNSTDSFEGRIGSNHSELLWVIWSCNISFQGENGHIGRSNVSGKEKAKQLLMDASVCVAGLLLYCNNDEIMGTRSQIH